LVHLHPKFSRLFLHRAHLLYNYTEKVAPLPRMRELARELKVNTILEMKAQPITTFSKEQLRTFPSQSGVYLMRNADSKVIYVGKAKNLRARIRSYFGKGDGRRKVYFLRQEIYHIETLVTESERQALVLESDLIKKYKPHYNARLKDDKAHLLVRIDLEQTWPRLELVRKVEDDSARYFGPFAFSHELYTLMDVIKRSIPLRTCSNRVFSNRVRPCLEHQIKRCSGPCCLDVDRQQYMEWVQQAVSILEGRNKEVIELLELKMQKASDLLLYEEAAEIRDRIGIIRNIHSEKSTYNFSMGAKDAFGLYRDGNQAELSVLMIRNGRLFEAKSFGFSELEAPDDELLSSLLTQFYDSDHKLPEEIILPFSLEDQQARRDLYSERAGRSVKISVPKRGTKFRVLTLAQSNAKQNFTTRFGTLEQGDNALKILQKELGLEQVPRTIECADISHFQGGATVGSVVHFKDGVPDKTRYRVFHLTQEGKPDDFASMAELLMRHLSRGAEENTLPDLIVIDGGRGQLSQALRVRTELSLSSPVMIGLAKKRVLPRISKSDERPQSTNVEHKPERIFVESYDIPVILAPNSKALHLLEQLRDEAHRFAITFHRKTRAKKIFRSDLEVIPGVGPKRRKALLKEFGSVSAIRAATAMEISERCSIPLKFAERILVLLTKNEK